jgi:hypothetical protein
MSIDYLHELVGSLPGAEIATAERLLTKISEQPIGPEFAESIRRRLARVIAQSFGGLRKGLKLWRLAIDRRFTNQPGDFTRRFDAKYLRNLATFGATTNEQ